MASLTVARTAKAVGSRNFSNSVAVYGDGDTGESVIQPSQETDFQDFLRAAKKRFDTCVASWAIDRREALEDLNFRAGLQWDSQIENDRALAGRPCLTINRIPQFIKQVTNEQRQNRPSIQINPVAGSDSDTAEILEGMIRHIEVDSEADTAYDTACDHQTTCGIGYIRVLTEYDDKRSFDQKIVIRRIPDPFKVYFDPDCQELDFSDARYCFVFEDIPKDEYRLRYPESKVAGMMQFTSIGDTAWFPETKIRIAEYFWVEDEDRELIKWADGTVHWADESPREQITDAIQRRTSKCRVIHWCRMNAVEIMAGRNKDGSFKVIPGQWIPIVPVLGDEIIVDGRRQFVGMVRFARDAQRQYNYMRTAVVEAIALAPKAPYIMAEGQSENHEDEWKSANTRNLAALIYKPVALGNQLAPAPQRNQAEPPIQAMSVAIGQADNDLKATMGIYDASLGAPGPEQSGKAILARQKEGDTANYNFIDNLNRALRHLGRIIVAWIPVYYDVPRIVEIVKPDGEHTSVPVNQPFAKMPDGSNQPVQPGMQNLAALKIKMHNLTDFRCTVTISTGPNYQTKRMEAVASILQLVQAFPQVMSVAGDLLVGYMDWHGAKEVSQRLKLLLPPGAQVDDDTLSPQKIQQLMQQHQALTAEVQRLTEAIKTKQPELELKKYVAELQALSGIEQARIKKGMDEGTKETAQLELVTNLAHDAAMAEVKNEQDAMMQRMDHAHQADMQRGQQAHEAALQQGAHAQEAQLQDGAQQHEQNLQDSAAAQEPPAEAAEK